MRNSKVDKITIAAPEGIIITYEIMIPMKHNTSPIIAETNIKVPILFVNNPAIAVGAVNNASMRMIPTARIRTTTDRAINIKRI